MHLKKNRETSIKIDNIYCKYIIYDKSKPIIITFSNAQDRIPTEEIDSSISPWGFEFIKAKKLNVISFACIDTPNWYTSKVFHSFLEVLSIELDTFPIRLGYGGSMGGFGVSAFSNLLNIDKILIINPISTLNKKLVPFENRFSKYIKNFKYMNRDYEDGAVTNSKGYIIYDPLYRLDKNHADRYTNLTHLRLPGMGHGIIKVLNRMNMLKWIFEEFVQGDFKVDRFHKEARQRRFMPRYYKWLLSEENLHLTDKRKMIIEKYHKENNSRIIKRSKASKELSFDKKKKEECIVHIGMNKTGSTSIQTSLHEDLKSDDFFYPDLSIPNHSIVVCSIFSKMEALAVHRKRGRSENEIAQFNLSKKNKLIKSIVQSDKPIMIISGESIPALTKNELEDFKDFLHIYFNKVSIVAYIRTPKSYMESAFQQRVKSGHSNFDMGSVYPNYRNKFRKFDLVFGRENVRLWKFDTKNLLKNSVTVDFYNRIGITMEPGNVNVNKSLSMEALSLLYIYRKYGVGFGIGKSVIRENKKLIDALRNIGSTKIKFSAELVQATIDDNRDDIEWMEKRLGESLNENLDTSEKCIHKEEDILEVTEKTFSKLVEMIGTDNVLDVPQDNKMQKIADMVHLLRMKAYEDYCRSSNIG